MTTLSDRERLAYLAAQVEEGVILEIGAKKGASTCAMAIVARVPVYTIDLWDLTFQDDRRPDIHIDPANFSRFKQHIKAANCEGKIIPVKGLSAEIAKVWDKPIGMLFIDGDHSYKGCIGDYKGFAQYIIPGGYLVFHDYNMQFGETVVKAVDEIKLFPEWTDWELRGFSTISARRL